MQSSGGSLKKISQTFVPREQAEGVGAKVKRFIGVRNLPNLDPFLMLDNFNVKLPAGFPDHPHRGMETVTYMLSGEMLHEDFKGNAGNLGPGDVQWMTAGKGIVHAEIPASFDIPANGFQLWLNLDRKNKYCEPQYQEYKANDIPVFKNDEMIAKVVAGEVFGVKGPVTARTPAYFIDFNIKKGTSYQHIIPKEWNSMIVCHSGSLLIQDAKQVSKGGCCVFEINENSDEILKLDILEDNTKFVMLAGKPINEPIAAQGPFVLNEKNELYRAFDDYQCGKNGFEGA